MTENIMGIELPVIGEKIYTSPKKGTNVIYEATYKGEPCYLIEHISTGYMALFDYETRLLSGIKGKITRCGSLVCNKQKGGKDTLKFHKNEKEKSISLRLWLFSKYEGIDLEDVRGCKIMLKDDDLLEYKIIDLRSCNLFDAGGERMDRRGYAMAYNDPGNADRKCIAATYLSGDKEYIETYDYSPELLTMLNTSRFCNIGISDDNERLNVIVHYRPEADGYKTMTLSRFVLLYYTYFDRYRRQRGAIKRFIHDIVKLRDKHAKDEAAHVYALRWLGYSGNLMWMNSETNQAMSNIIDRFSGDYGAFSTITEAGEILVSFLSHGKQMLYKCKTPEDYLDLQEVLVGRGITRNLKTNMHYQDHMVAVPTPRDIAENAVKAEQPFEIEKILAAHWEHCNKRDQLQALYATMPKAFRPWTPAAKGIQCDNLDALWNVIRLHMGGLIE